MNRVQSRAAVGDSIRVRHRASASRRLDIFHAASEEQSQFQLNVRRSLKMHGRLALGVALVGFLLSAIYLWRYWPVYSAEAVVYIQPAPAVEAGSGSPMHWPYNYDPATYES